MKTVTMFMMEGCPYCIKAKQFISQLRQEDPKYAAVKIDYIDESKNRELADSMDYYYIPTFYVDGVKVHEGSAEKSNIRAVLDEALR